MNPAQVLALLTLLANLQLTVDSLMAENAQLREQVAQRGGEGT